MNSENSKSLQKDKKMLKSLKHTMARQGIRPYAEDRPQKL